MCAVILIFAFSMSLVINKAEQVITRFEEQKQPEEELNSGLIIDKRE